jgi:hypothetical protein
VYQRWLAGTAPAFVLAHHLGLLPDGLGSAPDGTQWADRLQLVVPLVVLCPAAMVLRTAAEPPAWATFGVGCVVYASGQGIHLAANSVNNADPSATAHLWDEIVGHHVWCAGTALVLLALARTMPGSPRPAAVGYVLALGVGLTWASNAVGGHTGLLSLLVALVASAFGW